MSDRLYAAESYTELGSRNFKPRYNADKKTRIVPVLYALFGSAALVMFLVLGFSLLALKTEVRGTSLVSAEEVLRVAGIREKSSVFTLDLAKAEIALEIYYRIKNARIDYSFPGKLVITIEERVPVGMIITETEAGATELVCIDAEGIIIGSESDFPGNNALPVLSGIVLRNYRNGNRLDERFLPALRSLDILRNENPKLMDAFSEFQFVEKTKGYIEVLAYPVMYKTPLRLGSTVEAASLQVGIWILDAMRDKTGKDAMAELDLRGKIYTAKFKEAVSG